MNKKEISAALKAAGINFDGKLPVEELKALAEANGISTERTKPSLVTVRVVSTPVYENDIHQPKGAVFETTTERASALGDLVEIVPPAE